MFSLARIAVVVLTGTLLIAGAAPGSIIFSDSAPKPAGPPDDGNWVKLVDPNFPLAGLYVINSGNSHQWYTASDYLITGFPHQNVADVAWGVGSVYTGGSVTPSAEGPIETINYVITGRRGSPDGASAALLLIQDRKYYRSVFHTQGAEDPSVDTPYAGNGLTAADFGEFVGRAYDNDTPADGTADFASNPDFSATGSEIQFGWLSHFDSSLSANTEPAVSAQAFWMTSSWSVTVNSDIPLLPGDANRDGRVDGEDFLIWQASFGMQEGAAWDDGDFNGDGRVDGEDFLIWQAHFGTAAGSLVPEPTAALLAAIGMLPLLARRRT